MGVLNRLYALSLLLKSFDILTTTIAVSLTGSHVEANPIVKFSIDQLGLAPAMLLNFVIFYIMASIIHYKKGVLSMALITILLATVVVNNVFGLLFIKGEI